jgi:hypothetical protein
MILNVTKGISPSSVDLPIVVSTHIMLHMYNNSTHDNRYLVAIKPVVILSRNGQNLNTQHTFVERKFSVRVKLVKRLVQLVVRQPAGYEIYTSLQINAPRLIATPPGASWVGIKH